MLLSMRWIIILLLLSAAVEAKVITEIFYNPSGEDNNFEYVEVKLNNLSPVST